jgi:hypothetical protein
MVQAFPGSTGRGRNQALESKVRFADQPDTIASSGRAGDGEELGHFRRM